MFDIPFKTGLYEELPKDINYFYDAEFTDVINFPTESPSVYKVNSINVSVDIKSTKLIKTPVMRSFEGHILSGYKLNVEAIIKEKIIYESRNNNKVMYVPYYDTKVRNFFIVLPEIYNGQKVETLIRRKDFSIRSYLVDAYPVVKNIKSIYRYINLIIYLEFLR